MSNLARFQSHDPAHRRYLRVCMGGESGEPGLTLYEVDPEGWVLRQVQLHAEGSRFSPEDILMCHPVMTEAMAQHPATDEISAEEFEEMWRELQHERPFLARVPDPTKPWVGQVQVGSRRLDIVWDPDEDAGPGWACVPGFTQLFVQGDARDGRLVCGSLFIESTIRWFSVRSAAA